MNERLDYSLVICTYNPDERILRRCLEAISRLNRHGLRTETILVDNNSNAPVNDLACVKELAPLIPGMKSLFVAQPGVKYARMAAIEQATGKHIVYIDYDNEPGNDYLQGLKELNESYPNVAAWGPGHVSVQFIDGIDERLEPHARIAFQERHEPRIAFDDKQDWQPCYPFGTGLCTLGTVLKEYVALEKQGHFTLAGRTANRLSSGEDTQMVLLCIKKGYSAGVSPLLRLNHLINASRTSEPYLRRLAYGTISCYATCLVQVFPTRKIELERTLIARSAFARRAVKRYVRTFLQSDPLRWIHYAQWIGERTGIYQALHREPPAAVNWIMKKLRLT